MPNTPAFLYGQLVLAALLNLGTVYAMKQAEGFTRLWPSLAVLVSIGLVQVLVSRVMASGMQVGLALTAVVVFVMLARGRWAGWSSASRSGSSARPAMRWRSWAW